MRRKSVTRPLWVSEPPADTASVHGVAALGGSQAEAAPAGTGIWNAHDCVPVKLEPSTQSDEVAPAVPGSSKTGPPSPAPPARTLASTSLSSASCTSVTSSVATRGPAGLVNASAGLARRTPDSV